jgi:ribose transport system substrate-binding protein
MAPSVPCFAAGGAIGPPGCVRRSLTWFFGGRILDWLTNLAIARCGTAAQIGVAVRPPLSQGNSIMRWSMRGAFSPFVVAGAVAALFLAGCEDAAKPTTSAPSGSADAKSVAANTTTGATKGTTPAAGGAPSDAKKDIKRIIVLQNENSPFWDAARAGLQDAENDLKLRKFGLRAALEVNNAGAAGQVEKLQQFSTQPDIVGVGISAVDADNVAVAEELRKLQKRGVKIVTIDSDVDRDKFRDCRFAFIGTENLLGGRELGACAKGLRPSGGGYVTFVGHKGAQNAIERIRGFKEGAGSKFQAIDSMVDGTDRPRARENVRNAIQNHKGKLTTLVGIWSYNAPAITDVVKELGVRKDYTIVVFDAEPIAIQEIGAGNIDAMVVQNPYEMGYQGVRLLKALHENDENTVQTMLPHHGQPEGDLYDTGLKIVVPDDKSPLTPALFGPKTEFLTLGKFKMWLNKYRLEGS